MIHNPGHRDAGHPRSKGLWRAPGPALINVLARACRIGAFVSWLDDVNRLGQIGQLCAAITGTGFAVEAAHVGGQALNPSWAAVMERAAGCLAASG